MAIYLIDKSAYSRLGEASVDYRLIPLFISGAIAITGVSMLEILFSARDADSYRRHRSELGSMTRLARASMRCGRGTASK